VAATPVAAGLSGRLLTAVAAGIDGLMLRAARVAIDFALMPPPEETEALRASAAFYVRPELLDAPGRFFGFLDNGRAPLPEVSLTRRRTSVAGAERFTVTFPSVYEPVDPSYAAELATHAENRVARAELWCQRDRPARGTVIGLHGFGMGYPALDAPMLMTPALFGTGLDVALFTLPFHGARTPAAARFSGELFAQPSVPRINEAIGQAVHDLTHFVAWLRTRGTGPIGIVGLSLGGYVAALMAAVAPDLDFAIPMVAPVCLGDLAFRFMHESRRYRHDPDARLSYDELRAAYRVHSPLTHPVRMPRHRLLIVAGLGDRIVPPEHAAWLWAHWDYPRLHWFEGSHLVPFGRAGVLRAIRRFLRDLGVV
jgi:pimeloyl-ACP methyl ester carboxylesterase